jgi:hypothetical protein
MGSVDSRAVGGLRDHTHRRERRLPTDPQRPCLRRRSFGEFHFMKLQSGSGSSHDYRGPPVASASVRNISLRLRFAVGIETPRVVQLDRTPREAPAPGRARTCFCFRSLQHCDLQLCRMRDGAMGSVDSRAASVVRDHIRRRERRACPPIPQRPCLRRRSVGDFIS